VATARDLIEAALREIGVLAATETAGAQDATDALARLNRYIDRLSNEGLTIYSVTRSTWTIVAGTQNYSVGSGGAINITRPHRRNIQKVQFVDLGSAIEYPLATLTDDAYEAITLKSQSDLFPQAWYYNPTYPTGTLHFWPIPSSSTLLGVFYHWAAVAQLAALSTSVSLPPGYEEMLVTNLAMLLCPTYERNPHPVLVKTAAESLGTIKRANKRVQDLEFEPAALVQGGGPGSYSIYEG
jgi:hypothetical protein